MSHPLGQLQALQTADGSLSLHSAHFDEAFHSSAGALEEAETKFVRPSELSRFEAGGLLRVLDVCVGLGYNSAALMRALSRERSARLLWWGLEMDERPMAMALKHRPFRTLWPSPVVKRLEQLHSQGVWEDAVSEGTMLWGDARQTLNDVPRNCQMDLIFMDAFSPSRCPQLWSEEFLGALADRLAPGGRLITYSRAAAVRGSLRRAGLELRSLLPAPQQRREWSSGTLAVKPSPIQRLPDQGPGWRSLQTMEEQHLNTRAAVPYRDPDRRHQAQDILRRRQFEQQRCGMESTSAWQRRWIGSMQK